MPRWPDFLPAFEAGPPESRRSHGAVGPVRWNPLHEKGLFYSPQAPEVRSGPGAAAPHPAGLRQRLQTRTRPAPALHRDTLLARRPSEKGLAPARCVSPVDETRPCLDPFYGACHIHRDTPEADRGSRTSDRVGLNPFYGACYIHRDTPEAERGSTTSDAEEPHSSSGLAP